MKKKVSLAISGEVTQSDYDDIDKIAMAIGTSFTRLFGDRCSLTEIQHTLKGKIYSYEVEFIGEPYLHWLSNMNPVNLFAGFNAEQCKRKLEEIKIDVSDSFIDKILSGKIKIAESIS